MHTHKKSGSPAQRTGDRGLREYERVRKTRHTNQRQNHPKLKPKTHQTPPPDQETLPSPKKLKPRAEHSPAEKDLSTLSPQELTHTHNSPPPKTETARPCTLHASSFQPRRSTHPLSKNPTVSRPVDERPWDE